MRALSPASSVKQPGIVAFEQSTAVAGGIALARDALTAKRTGRASNDNRTATRQVAYTSDGPAVDRNTASATGDGADPMHSAGMSMT